MSIRLAERRPSSRLQFNGAQLWNNCRHHPCGERLARLWAFTDEAWITKAAKCSGRGCGISITNVKATRPETS